MGAARDDFLGLEAWIYLVMGGFILFFALTTFALTGFEPFLAGICLVGGVAPSSLVVLYGLYRWSGERHLRALAAMAQTYRRLKLDEFARRAGKTRLKTERHLAEAVQRGFVNGFVDRTSDEFVVRETLAEQIHVTTCPTCGAGVNLWVFPEERFPCPYCGAGIRIPAPKAG